MQEDFAALYREHYPALRRYADRRVGNAAADDIVASTFELAYRKLPVEHPHPVGWLFRTASNLMKAEVRRREKERRTAKDVEVLGTSSVADADLEILRVAMERMPGADRTLLQLTYWDGLSAAEAGVVLGCSEQAVWKRISRAKAALRDAWPHAAARTMTWEEAITNV